jgi:hypothetical protein
MRGRAEKNVMAKPNGDYVKYVIGGACGSDTWSIGLWQKLTGMSSTPTPAQMNAAALFRLNGFKTLVWTPASVPLAGLNATGVNLATAKAYLYRNGVLSAQGTASITASAGTSTRFMPFYTALCVSLLTNTPGRSGRGRVYLPYTGATINGTTGQSSDTLTTIANNFASMATGYGPDDNGFPGDPTSELEVVSSTHATSAKVVSVRIDSIPDTQHGRTRKVVATSTATASV